MSLKLSGELIDLGGSKTTDGVKILKAMGKPKGMFSWNISLDQWSSDEIYDG